MSKVNFNLTATLREPTELVGRGLAAVADLPDLEKVAARYAVAVTPAMAALIDPDDPDDPIARQFIPSAAELLSQQSESTDPIGDHAHSPVTGIVHRYPDRVLFKLVHVCAVYCRFCFRREMVGPGKGTGLSPGAYDNALAYIRAHSEIWEVILTGGDLGCPARQPCPGIDRQGPRRMRRHHRRGYPDGQPVRPAARRQ
jgi:lysine 2,3-aminomutase